MEETISATLRLRFLAPLKCFFVFFLSVCMGSVTPFSIASATSVSRFQRAEVLERNRPYKATRVVVGPRRERRF